jgi:hypothetical protein
MVVGPPLVAPAVVVVVGAVAEGGSDASSSPHATSVVMVSNAVHVAVMIGRGRRVGRIGLLGSRGAMSPTLQTQTCHPRRAIGRHPATLTPSR